MYITIFPIFGCAVGVSYTDSFIRGEEPSHYNEHQLQLLFFFVGITFGWSTNL